MGKLNDQKIKEMDGKILKVLLRFHMEKRFNAKVDDVANELGVHVRTTSFRNRWCTMKNEKNFIGPGEGRGVRLTSEGLKEATNPKYKEMMKEILLRPKTSKEHQHRIKKFLKKPKSRMIFDLLLEFNRLNKTELAKLVGLHIRTRGFTDSLAELRSKTYIEKDGNKKFYLTSKCFMNGKDNCSVESTDNNKLAAAISEGAAQIDYRKRGIVDTIKNLNKHHTVAKRKDISDDTIEKSSDDDENDTIKDSSNKRRKKEIVPNDTIKVKVVSMIPYTNIKSENYCRETNLGSTESE